LAKLVKKSPGAEEDFLPDVLRMADLAADVKALDIKACDVRGLTLIADCFVMCSASSQPQFKAIFNRVKDGMKAVGVAPLRAEGVMTGHWLILDYGTIIFHVFREEAREFYDLDGLWGDAPQIGLDLGPH